MAFQDFGHLTERRKAEKRQQLKRRITVTIISVLLLFGLTAAGVFAYYKIQSDESKPAHHKSQPKDTKDIKVGIKAVCSNTDYKSACESSLSKATVNSSNYTPKALLKAAISVVSDQVNKASKEAKALKFEKKEEKEAFEDCIVLMEDAKEELERSISHVGAMGKKGSELNNWLSAVMSYQQTCIDGFPEGTLKSKLNNLMKDGKELTSNALAIVSEVTKILSKLDLPKELPKGLPGLSRRLLDVAGLDEGLPSWMGHEERRILGARKETLVPNVTVAKDGSGQFKTISAALEAMPKKYTGRYVVYVKAGVYDETVTVTKKMVNVTMYGDGSQKSVVTGRKNFVDGTRTFETATFAALGEGFMAKAMGFRNTAGPEKHQAVALRVQSDRSIFLNCRMEGYQDTLYAQTHRQFYRSCVISGTIDFIFGDASAVVQTSMLVVRKPLDNQQNIITAQGRLDRRETTGLVLQNCKILADPTLDPKLNIKSYLGRPWKEYSRTIVMESEIGQHIHADGWLPWQGDFGLKTLYYAEYKNTGPGAGTKARVKWPGYKGVISPKEALQFTVGPFLQGDEWLKGSGAPVHFGLL